MGNESILDKMKKPKIDGFYSVILNLQTLSTSSQFLIQEVTEAEMYPLASREGEFLAPTPTNPAPGKSHQTAQITPNKTFVSRSVESAGLSAGLSAGNEQLPKSTSLVSLDDILCEATDPEIEGYKRLFQKKFKKIPPIHWR